jgi:hypothetical protein
MSNALVKFQQELANIPPPGGNGCHSKLLGLANLGVIAGLDAQVIHDSLRNNIPPGKRRISDTEINDAIKRAINDYHGKTPAYIKPSKPKFNAPKVMDKITKAKLEEVDIWDNSPIRIDWGPDEDTSRFLELMFLPDDILFIGQREDKPSPGGNILTQKEWIKKSKSGQAIGPLICVNPLSGNPGPKKNGEGDTYRGDACINSFRHCLVEFDDRSMSEQLNFWGSDVLSVLPVKALIDSGGKSVHAWIDVQKLTTVNNPDDWAVNIKSRLYEAILKPLGVDGACSNPSRLSRLPGYKRDTGRFQKLLWVSDEGRGVMR